MITYRVNYTSVIVNTPEQSIELSQRRAKPFMEFCSQYQVIKVQEIVSCCWHRTRNIITVSHDPMVMWTFVSCFTVTGPGLARAEYDNRVLALHMEYPMAELAQRTATILDQISAFCVVRFMPSTPKTWLANIFY